MQAADERSRKTRGRVVSAPISSLRGGGRTSTRRSAALSVIVHVAVIAVLTQVLIVPMAIRQFLSVEGARRTPSERITYIATPPARPNQPGRSGGDNRPVRAGVPPTPAPPLVAPREVPSAVPPATDAPPRPTSTAGGSGPLVGRGGPLRGIEPSYSDPRIWGGSSANSTVAEAPKTEAERLDSALKTRVGRFNDSVVANGYSPSKFERGDWTVGSGDSKWGVDQRFIRLGKVSIPTAILGLLPMNVQGNPIAYERERSLSAMRADIQYHAARAMNEEEFRKAVKSLRERKDRERERERDARRAPVATPDNDRVVP